MSTVRQLIESLRARRAEVLASELARVKSASVRSGAASYLRQAHAICIGELEGHARIILHTFEQSLTGSKAWSADLNTKLRHEFDAQLNQQSKELSHCLETSRMERRISGGFSLAEAQARLALEYHARIDLLCKKLGQHRDELNRWTGGAKALTKAIVFTDIVDSTKVCNTHGDDQWAEVLQQHIVRASNLIRDGEGFLVKNTGDGVLALFHSASDAVEFALELHHDSGHAEVRTRVGVHIGQVSVDADDISGQTVNLTQRIMKHLEADGVIVSERVKSDIAQRGEARFSKLWWTELPSVVLKGFSEPMRLWRVDTTLK
jgi:class 3 adenylate cyclase